MMMHRVIAITHKNENTHTKTKQTHTHIGREDGKDLIDSRWYHHRTL